MNAVSSSSRMGRGAGAVGAVLLMVLVAALHFVRLVLFSVLATFEPIVRAVLCFACLACFGMSAFYKLAASPNVHFPYATMLLLGAGAAVTVVFYEMIVRGLRPKTP
jgi:Na+/serine symporter